jgi:hypothetical protein
MKRCHTEFTSRAIGFCTSCFKVLAIVMTGLTLGATQLEAQEEGERLGELETQGQQRRRTTRRRSGPWTS